MGEVVKTAVKPPEGKKENQVSQVQKGNFCNPVSSPVEQILFLQRTIGNQAVQKLMKSGALQAKLRIGAPGDVYEQEADRVAEQVMRMPQPQAVSSDTPSIQRACPKCEEGELKRQPIKEEYEEKKLQRKPVEEEEEELQTRATSGSISVVNPDIESLIQSFNGIGKPLSINERAFFEPRFGQDFSHVRVHTDAQAAEAARAVNARAFTVGKDVAFGQGEYAPETAAGKELLAHELTHIIQQGSSPASKFDSFRNQRIVNIMPSLQRKDDVKASEDKGQKQVADKLRNEAKEDAQKIKKIFQDNTVLGPFNQRDIMGIIEKWAEKPADTGTKLAPFDYLIVALRTTTFEVGTLVKQYTSAFDQIFHRMSSGRVEQFKGWMQTRSRVFKDEKAIEMVKFEVSKEDVLEAAQLSAEVTAAFATGGGSVLAQIIAWLAGTLPSLYQKAKAVFDFVNTIRNIKLDDVKKLINPKGLGDLLVKALFGEVQGLQPLGKEEEGEKEEEPASGREEKGLVKVFHVMIKILKALKKVYNRVVEGVNKTLSIINITTKKWFEPFSMVYASLVKAINAVSDPAAIINDAVSKIKETIGDFFKNIKSKVEETAGAIKAHIQIIGKPAQLMKTMADRAVEMVLNFIITHPPSALVKLAFKAVETGAGKSILQLIRENIPFADKLINKIAESDTVKTMLQPLEPPVTAVGNLTDRISGEAGGLINDVEGNVMNIMADGSKMVGELAGVNLNQADAASGEKAGAKAQEKTGASSKGAGHSLGDFLGVIKQGIHSRLMAIGEQNLMQRGKEFGKAVLEKGVEAGKKAVKAGVAKVLGWLGLRKEFRVNNQSHSLSFDQNAPSPTLVLATTPVHITSWLNVRRGELQAANQYDGTKESAYNAIQKDLRTLGGLTYKPDKSDSAAEQEKTAKTLLDNIAANVKIIGFLGDTLPVPRMVVTPGFSSQKAEDMTVQFLFNDPNNHRPGKGTSGKEPLLGAWDKLNKLGITRSQWISGHMLNATFGGLPENSNLIPMEQKVNRKMVSFDNQVMEELYEKRKPIWMRFIVRREHPQDADRHFVSYFKAEAAEMPLREGIYQPPSAGTITFEKSGTEMPYPALRTSSMTLNGLIRSHDQSRDAVRSVAAATQLSERLVIDLVKRGIVLNSIDEIGTFIRSKVGEYGQIRFSGYLAKLERYRGSIVL